MKSSAGAPTVRRTGGPAVRGTGGPAARRTARSPVGERSGAATAPSIGAPTIPVVSQPAVSTTIHPVGGSGSEVAIRMLHGRVLATVDDEPGERRSGSGILIPATASLGKKLSWARVVAVAPNVRTVEVGDRVLFDDEDRAEVEVRGSSYVLLRERTIHAVAAARLADGRTGLYL